MYRMIYFVDDGEKIPYISRSKNNDKSLTIFEVVEAFLEFEKPVNLQYVRIGEKELEFDIDFREIKSMLSGINYLKSLNLNKTQFKALVNAIAQYNLFEIEIMNITSEEREDLLLPYFEELTLHIEDIINIRKKAEKIQQNKNDLPF